MKKGLLILYFTLISILHLHAQSLTNEKMWGLLLTDVKIRYSYSLKYDALFPKPKFGKELKKYNGQIITLRGFFLPVDITGNVFVLSYNPMNMCFFCTGDGLQTIVELNPLPAHLRRFSRLKTDNYFEVKGKLKLNADNYEHLIYILDEVEFVKLIR
jgi:hypothetical protein